MRLRIMSDIHLEFWKDLGKAWCESLQKDGDVLILAGDILLLRMLQHGYKFDRVRKLFAEFISGYQHVIMVPGNHEYYGTSFQDAERIQAWLKSELGVHTLVSGQDITLDGQHFVGGTLWYPMGVEQSIKMSKMNDFYQIQGDFVERLQSMYFECLGNLMRKVTRDSVVITHLLPSYRLVSERYQGDGLNCFFVAPADEVIQINRPKVWIYGHTHESNDSQMEETRFIANPAGYKGENKNFNPNCIVEV